MGKALRKTRRFIRFNVPERHGFPDLADNENLPDIGKPALPAVRIRIPTLGRVVDKSVDGLSRMAAEEVAHGRRLLAAPVLLGLGSVFWFSLAEDPSVLALVFVFAVSLSGALLLRYRRPVAGHGLGAMALILAGALLAAWETERAATVLLDGPVVTVVHGSVEGVEAAGQGRWRYILALGGTEKPVLKRMPQRISILSLSKTDGFHLGDTISGLARLSPPSGPALPGLNDFAFTAYFSGIGANGLFYGQPQLEASTGDPGWWQRGQRWLAAFRSDIGNRIREGIGGDAGAFAAALVTNEQRAISKETIEALRQSGLAHIIAISGMNMALAAGLFFVGLRALFSLSTQLVQSRPTKKWAAFGAMLGTTAYYMISGFAVSAERAYLMMLIMLGAVLIDRPAISLRNVALSALIILCVSPSQVLGPGFQMSYAGTIGLVAAFEAKARWQRRIGTLRVIPLPFWLERLWAYLSGVVLTSLIGGAATLLFSAEHFQRLPAFGLAANVLAAPVLSFIVMPAGMLALILMPFGLDQLALSAMGAGLEVVIAIGKMVAGWGGELLTGPLPPGITFALTLGLLLLALLRTHLRLAGLAMSIMLIAALFLHTGPKADLILSEDGLLAAFVGPNGLSPNSVRPSAFLFDQWQRALGTRHVTLPKMISAPTDSRKDSADDRYRPLSEAEEVVERAFMQQVADHLADLEFACKDKSWCMGRHPKGGIIFIAENGIYAGPGCDIADIVIARGGPNFQSCKSGALFISREALRRTGALAFQFREKDRSKPVIKPSFHGENRAWNEFRYYDWRTGLSLPALPPKLAALLSQERRLNDQ